MDNLLNLLKENARLSTAELAVMLNKSEQEVKDQIAAYEKEGIIGGYQALINWEKAGDTRVTALIELRITPQPDVGFDAVAERVMRFEEVESVYLMSGAYDLAVVVHGNTMQDIAAFVARRLSSISGVISTATHFIMTRYKDGGVILNPLEKKDERRQVVYD